MDLAKKENRPMDMENSVVTAAEMGCYKVAKWE